MPEVPLGEEQILVLQVPMPEPLRFVEPSEYATKRLHAEKEYSGAYLALFEEIMKHGRVVHRRGPPRRGARPLRDGPEPHPALRQPQAPPLARRSSSSARGGRRRSTRSRPITDVASLDFEDHPFEVEDLSRADAAGSAAPTGVFMDELIDSATGARS